MAVLLYFTKIKNIREYCKKMYDNLHFHCLITNSVLTTDHFSIAFNVDGSLIWFILEGIKLIPEGVYPDYPGPLKK